MKRYLLSEEESIRFQIIKFIAIIFVVYVHSYATEVNFSDGTNTLYLPAWLLLFEDGISHVISSCGVPTFFLISSILLFRVKRTYGKTIKGKVKTLLIPYLIWNTFWIMVFVVLQSLRFTSPFFSESHTPILQSSIAEWFGLYGIGEKYPHDYPLWFMRDLMIVILLFPIIEKIASKFTKQLLIVSIILIFMPLNFLFKASILWVSLGACIVELDIHIDVVNHINIWRFSLIYIISVLITLMTDVDILHTFFVFIGIIYWTRVSKSIYDNEKIRKMFLLLSEWTFMIYVFHEFTLSSVKKLCLRLLPSEPIWLFLEYVFIPIIVIAVCIVVGVIFKKIAPKIYNISTGMR